MLAWWMQDLSFSPWVLLSQDLGRLPWKETAALTRHSSLSRWIRGVSSIFILLSELTKTPCSKNKYLLFRNPNHSFLQINFFNLFIPSASQRKSTSCCLCKLFPHTQQQTNKPTDSFLCNWAFLGQVCCCGRRLRGIIKNVQLRAGSRGQWLPWQLECAGILVYQKTSKLFFDLLGLHSHWWLLQGLFQCLELPLPCSTNTENLEDHKRKMC